MLLLRLHSPADGLKAVGVVVTAAQANMRNRPGNYLWCNRPKPPKGANAGDQAIGRLV